MHASNEKWQTTSDWRNGTTKSRLDQNARRKRNLQRLKHLRGWHHRTSRNERKKNTKENPRRTRKLLETKRSSWNLIKGINTWVVPLVWYSGPFLKWTREELKEMDQRTRKVMTVHKALHSRDDVDRLYVSRKEGGRRLATTEDSAAASIQWLEDYIEKNERGLITTIRNDTDNTMANRMTITWKQKWEEKQLYRRFKRLTNSICHVKIWMWLKKGNFKRETEYFLITAQNNAFGTYRIKMRIDKTLQNSKCTLCGARADAGLCI